MSDTRPKLLAFLKSELASDLEGIDVERDSLVETGVIDSLNILKLVEFIDTTLGVKVADDELLPENFDTLDEMTAFIDRKRG